MTTAMKLLLAGGAAFAALLLFIFLGAISWNDSAVRLENTTVAQYKSNQNSYDAMWKTIKEIAQVPDKYKEDFKQLLTAEATAKFGPEGSKATMQWFQERQIPFDSSMYAKIQNVIESGRQDFRRSQDELLDKQRKVADVTQTFWGTKMAGFFGFPRELKGDDAPARDKDGDGKLTVLDYPIVTSVRTAKAFATGQDEEISVFGK